MQLLFMPIIRHLLTTGGGALAASGYLSNGDVQAGAGAVMTLLGIAMSAWNAGKKGK